MTELSVSVVIPAYTMERWTLTKKAVESARRQSIAADAVVLCIDNNPELLNCAQSEWREQGGIPVRVLANRFSTDPGEHARHAKLYGEARRYGAGSARNTAAETVTSDIVAFMDDDAWAEENWLERLLAVYQDPSIVAVGGAPLPEYETRRPIWFPTNFDWIFGCAYEGLPATTAPLRHLIGANMSVRREALEAVGGFHGDEFDDLNLCMRLAGQYGEYRIFYAPTAVVHHFVPKKRVSWQYFWRRCFDVNRSKVTAFRRMGPAANLNAERSFVLRAITQQSVSAAKRGLTGEPGAFQSLAAMFVGLALAGLGHLRGRLDPLLPKKT
jgi:glucosyl-dolichyl phosphate glucuronosyltransferase